MDELFKVIISIVRLIQVGSKDSKRCVRVVALMAAFAFTVTVIAAGLVLVFGSAMHSGTCTV